MGKKRFIIITKGRSGSTFLSSLLNSSSEIRSYGEFFRFEQFKKGDKGLDSLIYNTYNYFYNNFYSINTNKNIGFKMLYHQIKLKHLLTYTKENNMNISKEDCLKFLNNTKKIWQLIKSDKSIKIIHLNRVNLLHAFISFRTSEITNEWHTTNKNSKNNDIQITIDKNALISFLEETTNEIKYYNDFFKNHEKINIDYEDINKSETVEKLKDFFDIDVKNLNSGYKKQITRPYCEIIKNYNEVKSFLGKTKWKHMLD